MFRKFFTLFVATVCTFSVFGGTTPWSRIARFTTVAATGAQTQAMVFQQECLETKSEWRLLILTLRGLMER